MSVHACTTLTEGCYRCDLGRDEMRAIEDEIRAEAQDAWLAYRDNYQRRRALAPNRVSRQLRRREFIAGYLVANEMEPPL